MCKQCGIFKISEPDSPELIEAKACLSEAVRRLQALLENLVTASLEGDTENRAALEALVPAVRANWAAARAEVARLRLPLLTERAGIYSSLLRMAQANLTAARSDLGVTHGD